MNSKKDKDKEKFVFLFKTIHNHLKRKSFRSLIKEEMVGLLGSVNDRMYGLDYEFEGMKWRIEVIKTNKTIGFYVQNTEINVNDGLKFPLFEYFRDKSTGFEFINETKFYRLLNEVLDDAIMKMKSCRSTYTSQSVDDISNSSLNQKAHEGQKDDPMKILTEVIRENKPRIISRDDPKYIAILSDLKTA